MAAKSGHIRACFLHIDRGYLTSQNLVHADISTTDGVYGILSNDDVGQRIQNLSEDLSNRVDTIEMKLNEALAQIQ